jgi:hypothetical protein
MMVKRNVGRQQRTRLAEFLNEQTNSTTREKIFLNKICFDLKLAAAQSGLPLQVFAPEVDRDGFDVLFDDGDMDRRFQLKSFTKSSGTTKWKVHKRLLRPRYRDAQLLGFPISAEGVGLGGGLIVILIDDSTDVCTVTYYYTDIFILTALAEGMMVHSTGAERRELCARFLRNLHHGVGKERVEVPLALCVKVRSPSSLLAIGGYHSTEKPYIWWGGLLTALQGGFRVHKTPQSDDVSDRTLTAHASAAIGDVLSLLDEPTLKIFPHKAIPGIA